ncbi:MAG: phosphotransferase [SAR86 cluster bacterium]|nr:phosphotransferase [SAR86 cluster bacterium]
MEPKTKELLEWVNQEAQKVGFSKFNVIKPLRIEASKRRYYRVENERESLIVNTLNPKENDNSKFNELSAIFLNAGVKVPRVFSLEEEKGFLLQEDFGDRLYQYHLNTSNSDKLLSAAIDEILIIQNIPTNSLSLPVLNESRAFSEMDLFRSWFLEKLLVISVNEEKESNSYNVLQEAYENVWKNLEIQPKSICHFDFESRNLLALENPDGEESTGIIDFQDALIGPVSLDLVSLLKDLYHPLSDDRIIYYADLYLSKGIDSGVLKNVNLEEFISWIEWSGIQRQLRIMGVLSRMYILDKKKSRLLDLETTMNYLIKSSEGLHGMIDFYNFLVDIKPKLLAFLAPYK